MRRGLLGAKKIIGLYIPAASTSKRTSSVVQKGFLAVYVGESQKMRYIIYGADLILESASVSSSS